MPKKTTTPFVIGGILGAITIMILSFSMGWVVTSGRAHATAQETASEAIKGQLVPICIHQFRKDADSVSQLEKLRELGDWDKGEFVAEHGWATMPGSDSPETGVARECAAQLSAKSS